MNAAPAPARARGARARAGTGRPVESARHHRPLGSGRVHHGQAVARRTPRRRSAAGRGSGRSGRCRARRSSAPGSGARSRGSASSSGASGRSTRSGAGRSSPRPRRRPRRRAAAVALDEALVVGIAGATLLAVAAGRSPGGLSRDVAVRLTRLDRSAHGRASNTRLNGVSAARRKRVKPPAATTSPIRASPACAPSASPTSCDSDAGVHRNVENAVVGAADRVEVVLDAVAGHRLDDHPRAVRRERLVDVARGADRVAHVVQAVEHRHEVVAARRDRAAAAAVSKRTRSATPASCARWRAVSIEPSW